MSSFYETIFIKEDSSLDKRLEYLRNNPNANKDELHMLELGTAGEKQVVYHLNKSNIGMFAMRDINLKCDELKAQIDFIAVTSHHCYFIECKNYNADIIHVDETGNFETSTRYKNKYNKIGIKSPLSQVDDQLTVFKKICLKDQDKIKELLDGIKFNDYFKTIVVFTNHESRLDTKKAPNDMKYRILKVDNLIRQIEYDDKHYKGKRFTKEQMDNIATYILNNNVPIEDSSFLEYKPLEVVPESYYNNYMPLNVTQQSNNNIQYNNSYPNYQKYNYNKKRYRKRRTILGELGGVVAVIVFLLIFSGVTKCSNNMKNNLKNKSLSFNNIEAINNLKEKYDSAQDNGFDLYDYNQCKYLKEILPNTFSCSGLPMKVTFSGKRKLTINKNYTCYYLEYDLGNEKLISSTSKYIGYDDKQCTGIDIGFINYDPNNKYLALIGGYEKVLEMARFAHNYTSGFDNYYDFSHIAERGGNPALQSTYKLKVDAYFGTISNKGSTFYDNTLEDFNTMAEYYYYIMK